MLTESGFLIFFFMLVSLFVVLVSLLPYINLLLTKHLIVFLIFVSFFAIFKIGWRKILYIIFFLFFIIILLTLWERGETASMIGDYIYGFLAMALVSFFQDI